MPRPPRAQDARPLHLQAPRVRRALSASTSLLLSVMSLINIGCERLQGGDSSQSQWGVARWTMERALHERGPELSALGAYVSEEAREQLAELRQEVEPERATSLLTLNLAEGGRWIGRYGYLKGGWPLAAHIELSQGAGVWRLERLPFLKVDARLASLLNASKGGLPEAERGEPWRGGLISADIAARPQGEVVLSWAPPYAFIDGVPLYGKATPQKVIQGLARAFERREAMAAEAQASYFKRAALALSGETSSEELLKLIGWLEEAGASSVSLIARNARGEGRLVRLAQRTSTLSFLSPQRLLRAEVGVGVTGAEVTLSLQEPSQKSAQATQEPSAVCFALEGAQDRFEVISRFYQQASLARQPLDGLVIQLGPPQDAQALLKIIDELRAVSEDLPITLSPHIAGAQGCSQ